MTRPLPPTLAGPALGPYGTNTIVATAVSTAEGLKSWSSVRHTVPATPLACAAAGRT